MKKIKPAKTLDNIFREIEKDNDEFFKKIDNLLIKLKK